MIINGQTIALNILEELKIKVLKLKEKGITPTLAVILIGNNESSKIYVHQKELRAREIGVNLLVFRFDETVENQEIEILINKLDQDPKIHGIILQRPTPKQIEINKLETLISPIKEVDGFSNHSLYEAPVAQAVIEILKHIFLLINKDLSFDQWLLGQKVTVIGKGQTAGEPIIRRFKKLGVEPIIIDSKTKNTCDILKTADIVISAVGKREAIDCNFIKNGTILIGVGLSKDDQGKTQGGYNENEVENITSFYTPTPKGVGPINVALLLKNLIEATENISK